MNHSALRRNDLSADEVVARQAVLRRQVPDAAAEREPPDPGRADDASGRDEAERLGRRVEVEPGRAALRTGDSRLAVHVDGAHGREIDHEPAVDDAVPRRIVPASPNGNFQVVRAREIECGRDITRTGAARDHRRAPIDECVEAASSRVVLGILGADDGAGQRAPQLVDASALSSHAAEVLGREHQARVALRRGKAGEPW